MKRRSRLLPTVLAASLAIFSPSITSAAPPTSPPTSSGQVQDKWAVVIGLQEFADPSIPRLHFSAKDARDFYDYLVDPNG
ncbi:MAG: hypothetical protein U0103_28795, partial [Candidatus Obscuribacterales bacterium]